MNADLFPVVRVEDPNRRYTTREFMEWIKRKANVVEWDVDVAADEESHHAPRWFSLLPYAGNSGVDGLAQSWLPPDPTAWLALADQRRGTLMRPWEAGRTWRVFCNPPFDDLGAWVDAAWSACREANDAGVHVVIGFVLPGNRHEQPFWQEDVEPFRDGRLVHTGYRLDCYFPPGRQAYAKPGSNGVGVGSADFPSALLVWRRA